MSIYIGCIMASWRIYYHFVVLSKALLSNVKCQYKLCTKFVIKKTFSVIILIVRDVHKNVGSCSLF